MIYEVRTYTLKPGAVPQWERHFEEALPNRVKHSPLAAFWHTEMGPLNQVIHVWPYENLQQRTDIRTKAAQEPGWPPKGGDLILNMESEIWIPAASPRLWVGARRKATSTRCAFTSINPGRFPRSGSLGKITARAHPIVAYCCVYAHRDRGPEPLDAHLALCQHGRAPTHP